MKSAFFLGDSLRRIKEFPSDARREAGFQLSQLQRGIEPTDWKPMPSIGLGVREIRIKVAGQFRVIYLATLPDNVYVLHAFAKKSQRTAKVDIELAQSRLKQLQEMKK
jgi:phage-related protein